MKLSNRESKYSICYSSLIESRKLLKRIKLPRKHPDFIYYEQHHILPQSIFPKFKDLKYHKWNGILLTPKEHFICHMLLLKHFKCINDKNAEIRMSKAMKALNNSGHYNSKTYQHLKLDFSTSKETKEKLRIYMTNHNKFKGKKHAESSKQLMSNYHKNKVGVKDKKGNFFKVDKDDTRLKSGEFVGTTKGTKLTEEHKKKISEGSNPNYLNIKIFNKDGVLEMVSNDSSFQIFCTKNNLPHRVLQISYQQGGKPIYSSKAGKTKVSNTEYEQYIGWYAISE